MTGSDRKSYLDRLLAGSVTVLLSAIALSIAWDIVRRLIPVLVIICAVVVVLAVVRWWRSYW